MTVQDYSLIKSKVQFFKKELGLKSDVDAFYFLVLESILDISDDDAFDSITDSFFLANRDDAKRGLDRGVDAVYIDSSNEFSRDPIIHLFDCKYVGNSEKAIGGNFPTSEIDKLIVFLEALFKNEKEFFLTANSVLKDKVQDILHIYDEAQIPKIKIHFCSNLENGFIPDEKNRFEAALRKRNYSNIEIIEHTGESLSLTLSPGSTRKIVNACFRTDRKMMFQKSDGDLKALVVTLPARKLLRIVLADPTLRNDHEAVLTDFSDKDIEEDAFFDNVRVYQKQRNRINRSIKETALGTERARFFYYNNGITLTCKKLKYPQEAEYPVVQIEDIQVVNGCQTVHALFDAAKENQKTLDDIEILCRIYESGSADLSSRIAEFTNSQNPVDRRDIRSIDVVQLKLEAELKVKGFFYERKKNQYSENHEALGKRIDAEKIGQILMAIDCEMPNEARTKKAAIFGNLYEKVFPDDITADKVLALQQIFSCLELRKTNTRENLELEDTPENKENLSVRIYGSYFMMYILGYICKKMEIPIPDVDTRALVSKYDTFILGIIKKAMQWEKRDISNEQYSNEQFFKSKKVKIKIDKLLDQCTEYSCTELQSITLPEVRK